MFDSDGNYIYLPNQADFPIEEYELIVYDIEGNPIDIFKYGWSDGVVSMLNQESIQTKTYGFTFLPSGDRLNVSVNSTDGTKEIDFIYGNGTLFIGSGGDANSRLVSSDEKYIEYVEKMNFEPMDKIFVASYGGFNDFEGCQEFVVNDGDVYFREDLTSPKWVWLLRNLDEVSKTEITSPSDLTGPIIGVASNFIADGQNRWNLLSEPQYFFGLGGIANSNMGGRDYINNAVTSRDYEGLALLDQQNDPDNNGVIYEINEVDTEGENYNIKLDSWKFPNDYADLGFFDLYPNEKDPWVGNRLGVDLIVKPEVVDLTNVLGVPLEDSYLMKNNAKVISFSSYAEHMAPYDHPPVIMLDYQNKFFGVGENIWTTNNNAEEGIYYIIGLKDVNEDYSLDFEVTKRNCLNNPCNYSFVEEFNIPLKQEVSKYDLRIFNQQSGFYSVSELENKEWAAIKIAWDGDPFVDSESTSKIYVLYYGGFGKMKAIIIYYDEDSGDLVFLKSMDVEKHYVDQEISFGHVDYYYGQGNILANFNLTSPVNFTNIDFRTYLYYPGSSKREDHILSRFSFDGVDGVTSLGSIIGQSEANEVLYYYGDLISGEVKEIGSLDSDVKTAHGIRVHNTKIYGGNDEVRFTLLNSRQHGTVGIRKNFMGGWVSSGVEFGNNAFIYPIVDYYNPAIFDYYLFDTQIKNPLNMLTKDLNYSGGIIRSHDSIVIGNITPRIETSLTSDNLFYEKNVFVETQSAYSPNSFPDQGIKYLYSFDDPVDLTALSYDNSINAKFLGENIKFIDYVDNDSIRVEVCNYSPCGDGIKSQGLYDLSKWYDLDMPSREFYLGGEFYSSEIVSYDAFTESVVIKISKNDLNKIVTLEKNKIKEVMGVEIILTDLDIWDIDGVEQFKANVFFEKIFNEQCDDGGNVEGDGCDENCIIEECGNGKIQYGEMCDDNNLINGDGCSELCQFEGGGCTNPATGIVSWWTGEFDNGKLKDVVGNEDGVVSGFNETSITMGLVGNSILFDGVNDYVTIENDSYLDLTSMSIEGWIKPLTNDYGQIMGKFNNYYMSYYEDRVGCRVDTMNGFGSVNGRVKDGSWNYVACTYNEESGNLIMYVGGVLVDSIAMGSNNPIDHSNKKFSIGGDEGYDLFKGEIDEVTVYNRALREREIYSIFRSVENGKCENFECSGDLDCDDENGCTVDSCVAGVCNNVDSVTSTCDDGLTHTLDYCEPSTGLCAAEYQYLRIFISNNSYTGGEIPNNYIEGSEFCGALARNAGLGGYWVPWLSYTTQSAKEFFESRPEFDSDVRYQDLLGNNLADNWTHLISGNDLNSGIIIDEFGNSWYGIERDVWTGTNKFGNLDSDGNCLNWTSSYLVDFGGAGRPRLRRFGYWTDAVKWDCSNERGIYCIEQPAISGGEFPLCGNNFVDAGEACDDGNIVSGDGCSSTCQLEAIQITCGNGVREAGEECDDGNTVSGDGCSYPGCLIEQRSLCGNGRVDGNLEECDDGNTVSGDGCSSTCKKESSGGHTPGGNGGNSKIVGDNKFGNPNLLQSPPIDEEKGFFGKVWGWISGLFR